MGLFKKAKKIAKSIGQGVKKYAAGGLLNSGKDSGGDLDARSAAAGKSIKDVKRQAGAGQIEYQTEE